MACESCRLIACLVLNWTQADDQVNTHREQPWHGAHHKVLPPNGASLQIRTCARLLRSLPSCFLLTALPALASCLQPDSEQQQVIREIYQHISKRADNVCNFLEGTITYWGEDVKLVYRHYATLYFVFAVDKQESDLGILDLIQGECSCGTVLSTSPKPSLLQCLWRPLTGCSRTSVSSISSFIAIRCITCSTR